MSSFRQQIQEEKEAQLAELEDELRRKSGQLIEFNQTKAKYKKLSLQMEEREAQIHVQMEEELGRRLSEMKTSVKEQIQMESFLKLKEKQNIIDSLKQKLSDATLRIEQGSMQMQGEMMELTVEEIVRNSFPTDEVIEIKKGQKGGDSVQAVRSSLGSECGRILYEVKNTKAWSDSFIDKIKTDNLDSKCDLLVIVTKTPPKEMENKHFMLLNGVWVTSLIHLSDMVTLLRFGLLKVQEQRQLHQNGDSKAHMLYAFLTSQECQSLFNSMMDGLKTLQEMNQEEERKLQTLFKKREKQLQQILSNFISYYGSVKSISNESIQDIEMLEFKKAS